MNEEDRGEIILVNGLRPLIEVQGGAYRVTDHQGFGDLLLYKKKGAGNYSLPTSLTVPFFFERHGVLLRCEGLSKMRSGRANLFVRECMPAEGHVLGMSLIELSPEVLLQSEATCILVEPNKAVDALIEWLWKFGGGSPQTVRSARARHPALADISPGAVFAALNRNGTMVLHDGVIAFAERAWLDAHVKLFGLESGLYRQEVYVHHSTGVPLKHLLWVIKS